jgi:HlyD family secretion protein
MSKVKIILFITSAALILIIGIVFSLRGSTSYGKSSYGENNAIYTITPSPVSSTLSLSGIIEPIEKRNIVSPFDGKISEKYFTYGQLVKKGNILAELDTSDLKVKLREAKTNYIRASQEFNKLKNWKKSNEFSRAKRSYTKAKNDIASAKRKVEASKMLFDQGIIPATEYDSAKEQQINYELAYKAAEEELSSVLEKGNKENLNIAKMTLENANIRMKELEEQLEKSEICAPVSGVILIPSDKAKSAKRELEKGDTIARGDILFSVGNVEGFSITAYVDEVNIAKIGYNQQVTITGDAFPKIRLSGKIGHISSQAEQDRQSGFPVFKVRVDIENLSEKEKKHVILGMTANMEVETYNNPEALLVPISCISKQNEEETVMKKDPDTGEFNETIVKTGIITEDSIEILSGLSIGDKVKL